MHVFVHLIRGDSNEAADASIYAAGLQQDVCAIGVVHGERQAVPKGVVYMRLHHMARCLVMSGQTCINTKSWLGCQQLQEANGD
jgi:hypothetical protein